MKPHARIINILSKSTLPEQVVLLRVENAAEFSCGAVTKRSPVYPKSFCCSHGASPELVYSPAGLVQSCAHALAWPWPALHTGTTEAI